jgi:hypothetical protein
MRLASRRPFFSNIRTILLYGGQVYHSNGLSLRLLGCCLRVANFGEYPKGEVRRIPILGTSVNKLENGALWRMCPMTLASRRARDRASESSSTKVSERPQRSLSLLS